MEGVELESSVSRVLSALETYRGWGRVNCLLDRLFTLYYNKRQKTALSLIKEKFAGKDGTIIIVCKGNVCRSAFLAEYLRSAFHLSNHFKFTSAGFRTSDGIASPETAQSCAKEVGVDLSGHSGSRLKARDVEEASLIVGMEPVHYLEFVLRYFRWRKKFVLLRALEKGPESLIVTDPFDKGLEDFQRCFSLLIEDGNILASALHEMSRKEPL